MEQKERIMNVVITGGLGVLGQHCAQVFLNSGAKIVLADLQEEKSTSLNLKHQDGQVKYIQCDVKKYEDCQELVTQSEAFFEGPIQVYLANAGVPFAGDFLKASQEQIQNVVNVNIMGSIYCAQTAIPSLLRSKQSHLIFTCSLQSTSARSQRSIYTASKHALAGLVKSLALEFARKGLRVNGIAPAAIQTPFLLSAFEGAKINPEQGLQMAAESLPLGRIPTADEFAQTALFLTSQAASSITGQLINLDAGAGAGIFPRQSL